MTRPRAPRLSPGASRRGETVLAALMRPAGRRRAELPDLIGTFVDAMRRGTRRKVGTLRRDAAAQRTDALLALVAASVAAERLHSGRWLAVLDALDAGACRDDIATAAGVSADKLAAGLDAHLRHRPDVYPDERRAALVARLGGVGRVSVSLCGPFDAVDVRFSGGPFSGMVMDVPAPPGVVDLYVEDPPDELSYLVVMPTRSELVDRGNAIWLRAPAVYRLTYERRKDGYEWNAHAR